jgi:membrane protein implicated in regulation of membrane protease activity
MDLVSNFYFDHPFWVWMAIAAVLLGVEVATGSGYLLWPAAAAALVGVITLFGAQIGLPIELALFAGLTIVFTLTARRFLPASFHAKGPDINDPLHRLVGQHGEAAGEFTAGHGRVHVDGKEWAAELEDGDDLAAGAKIKVTGVVGGARVRVRPA